jgi:hypothetical protein
MKRLALLVGLAAALGAGSASAQPGTGQDWRSAPHMSEKERQRMREDITEDYRDRDGDRTSRRERPRQMSAEEREKLRRDILDANKNLIGPKHDGSKHPAR